MWNRFPDATVWKKGLNEASCFLDAAIKDLSDATEACATPTADAPSAIVVKLCHRFHRVAKQLQDRYDERPAFKIEDEYDVQDLLRALLCSRFDDVRAEECTPSYAGSASRMDFLLKAEKIVVEVKKTRQKLRDKEIGNELSIDIARYQSHPDCKELVCFVYDPDGFIRNPTALERDLSKRDGDFAVTVVIAPKP